MKKVLLSCLAAYGLCMNAQTTIISPTIENGGFESGEAGWTLVNGTIANKWVVSSNATPGFSGTNAAYISNSATAPFAHDYTVTSGSTVYMYKDVVIPAGETEVTLDFKLLVQGEGTSSNLDYFRVYLLPTTVTPAANTSTTGIPSTTTYPANWSYKMEGSAWVNKSVIIPVSQLDNATAPSTKRLVFMWRNNTTNGTTPPAAIDDITMISKVPTIVPDCSTVTTPVNGATGVSTTVSVKWGASTAAAGYKLYLGSTPNGTDIMNGQDVGNVTTYAIPAASALPYSTTIYAKAVPYNAAGDALSCTETSFTTKAVPCPTNTKPLTEAQGVSLTPTISWSAVDGATGYTISMGSIPGATNILDNVNVGNVTSYTLPTALNYSSSYYYVVNAVSGTAVSASCTEKVFTTTCSPVSAPYTMNFDAGYQPNCWGAENPTTTSTSAAAQWKFDGAASNGASTALNGRAAGTYAWVDASTPYTDTHDVELISPLINLNGVANPALTFEWFKNHSSSSTTVTPTTYDDNKLTVLVSAGNGWTPIWNNSSNNASWREEVVSLANYANQTIQVKFSVDKNTGAKPYSYDDILLDNFKIGEAPTCFKPSSISVSNITTNSAVINWVAPTPAPASYDYYVTTSTALPTATTTPTGNTTATSANVTLDPSSTYNVWVRSSCSATDVTDWVDGGSFNTPCLPITTLPWSENFDAMPSIGAGITPVCWTAVKGTKAWTSYSTGSVTYNTPKSPDNYMALQYGNTAASQLWTPEFQLQAGQVYTLQFFYNSGISGTVKGWTGNVLVNSTPSVTNATDLGTFITATETTDNGYKSHTVQFTPTATGTYTFAVNVTSTSAPWYLGVDDFMLVQGTLATAEVELKDGIAVYPNPFKDVLTVKNVEEVSSLTVIDLSGKVVKMVNKVGKLVDLSSLNTGVYLLQFNMKNGSVKSVKAIKN